MDAGSEPAWTRLERLLADHYREQGYEVATPPQSAQRRRGTAAAFRLTLRRGDEHLLLLCRRDAHRPVTHQEVSDLLQAISRSGANGGVLITGGTFSTAARAAALRHERLQLVDGDELHLLFNLAIVDALKQALDLERSDAAAEETGAAAAGASVATPLPFYADVAAGVHAGDWAPEPGPAALRAPSRHRSLLLLALIAIAAAAALASWWLYRTPEAPVAVPDAAAPGTGTSRASSLSEGPSVQARPGRIHEQARHRVIALEGVTSAAWLSNGVLLLGMRDTGRAGQERATRQACAILGEYPVLAGMVVEVQDTGNGEGRGLQVSCL